MASIYSKAILTGGNFQDNTGNPLSCGYLVFTLAHDENVSLLGSSTGSQVVSGIQTTFYLDMNGSVVSNSGIWTNDNLTPAGSYYIVKAYNSSGLEVWVSPQIWTLTYSPTINIGTIQPVTP